MGTFHAKVIFVGINISITLVNVRVLNSISNMSVDYMKVLLNGDSVINYSEEELKTLPLCFFQNYVNNYTLLCIWGKLPMEYRSDINLQTKLTCFIHYNRPDTRTHIDGPATSQNRF